MHRRFPTCRQPREYLDRDAIGRRMELVREQIAKQREYYARMQAQAELMEEDLALELKDFHRDSLRVLMLGYATVTMALAPEGGAVTDLQNIRVEQQQQALVLNEVFVRAPKVNLFGDTVEYNVQSFVEQQDKSISDVLKRMPGVEVREGGDIYYNGESIGNLYVEDMDLLGGRYSLLTRNISAQDVKKVEIIEKHQPVKALKGITSREKPAINLVLQDHARGKWVGSAAPPSAMTSPPHLSVLTSPPRWSMTPRAGKPVSPSPSAGPGTGGLDTDHLIYRVSGSVKYMPGPRLSLTVSGSASNSGLDIHDFYSGYILRNYRYLTSGSLNTARDESYSVSGRINFKDPVNMFYIDGTVGRSWNILQTSSTQDFLGDYIVTGTEYAPSRGESWYASLSSRIGIYGINGNVGVTLSYMDFSTTSILQDGVRTPYLSQTVSLRPTFNGRLTRWMSLSYELGYSHYILSLPGTGTSESKDNFSHTLSLNLSPHRIRPLNILAGVYFTF